MNEREKQILYTIISHYIKTGESVGSRTIEKQYDFGISSATIRNAMADLEDKGLISKMHTSSGRIPTEDGYKIYIDSIMKSISSESNFKDVDSYVELKNRQVGIIVKNITEALSKFTKTTALSLEPSVEKHKLKKVELVYINEKRAYVVAITDLNIVKSANINLFNYTSEQTLKSVSEYINEMIAKQENYTLNNLIDFLDKVAIIDEGLSENSVLKFHMFNESSLLLHSDNLISGIKYIENKENFKNILKSLVDDKSYEPNTINVLFGSSLGIEELSNYVLMFSIYEYEGERAIICIIGPHRMNYFENINIFSYMNEMLKQSLANTTKIKLIDRR